MAFDMYHSSEKACIETHEESLFVPVNENPNYPCLDWLLAELYNSPRFHQKNRTLLFMSLLLCERRFLAQS